MFADEELVMELLINAGQARSDAMEAIRCAGQKDWQGATKLMVPALNLPVFRRIRFRPR